MTGAGEAGAGAGWLDEVEWMCDNCGRWWQVTEGAEAQTCPDCGATEW